MLDTASAFAITGMGSLIMRRLAVAAIGANNDLQISVWDNSCQVAARPTS